MLRVANVSVARGGMTLLSDVSFNVAAGQALILRGPNGIGKTTLIRALAGVQPVSKGDVDAPDTAYAGHADAVKATLTVEENLSFWAQIYRTDKVADALDAFDLYALRDRPAGLLSAGQKRRLGLSRMVMSGCPLWLLDEPTVSLDTQSVATFRTAILAHLAGGGCAVLSTHVDVGLNADVIDLMSYRPRHVVSDAFSEALE